MSGLIRELSTPSLIRSGLVGGLATTSGVALTATSGWLIVQASTLPPILTLLVAIVAVRTFGVARPALRYAERVMSHEAALRSLSQRRVTTYQALVPLTPARLGRRSRSDVLTAAVRDLDDTVDAQVRVVVPVIAALTAAVIAVVATAALLPAAGAVVAGVVASMVTASWWALRAESDSQVRGLRARAAASRVGALVTSHATEVQAIGARDAAGRWLEQAHGAVRAAAGTAGRIRGLGLAWQQLTTLLSTVAMALVVAPAVGGHVSRPVAALLLLTPVSLADATTTIPDAIGAWARARAAHGRLAALLGQEPAVADPAADGSSTDRSAADPLDPEPRRSPDTVDAAGTDDTGAPDGARGPAGISLTAVDVVARWQGDRPPLAAVTLRAGAGRHIAVVGANGAGKSTLLAVLARHLDPVSGRYLIGDQDTARIPLEDARRAVAIVDDEPHLFASTLRENLRLARPGAPDEDVAEAIRRAGLGDWLAQLPDGLDTRLGAGGRGVSGGERARIAIARAVLSDRPVFLLDEPVAHLDHATAMAVLDDLAVTSVGRTVVMISHRPDGLETMDEVVDIADLHSAADAGRLTP